jgi:hypothetical protein
MCSAEEVCDRHKTKTVKLLKVRNKYKPMDIREMIILKCFINT